MSKKTLVETGLIAVLIALAVAFVDPYMVLMPSAWVNVFLALLFVIFGTFAAFVWREQTTDEREEYHKQISSRFAFLFGAGVLVLAIIVQGLEGMIDYWLPIALVAMILGKHIGGWYSRRHH